MRRDGSPERAPREIAALEKERNRIREEIASYPPPIPACDEHYNHLLERRDQLSRELARLKQAAGFEPLRRIPP